MQNVYGHKSIGAVLRNVGRGSQPLPPADTERSPLKEAVLSDTRWRIGWPTSSSSARSLRASNSTISAGIVLAAILRTSSPLPPLRTLAEVADRELVGPRELIAQTGIPLRLRTPGFVLMGAVVVVDAVSVSMSRDRHERQPREHRSHLPGVRVAEASSVEAVRGLLLRRAPARRLPGPACPVRPG